MNRKPTEIRTAGIGPLARLPAFFALEGKRVVVVGSGQAAIWKAELLSAAGARVDVFSPIRSESLDALAAAPPVGVVIVHERAWTPADFAGTSLAVAECADDGERGIVCRRRARSRRAGQRHRSAGLLRFLVRRHRQSLAARHRHFHRRRRAGIRPSDPREDRSLDPEGLCPLG